MSTDDLLILPNRRSPRTVDRLAHAAHDAGGRPAESYEERDPFTERFGPSGLMLTPGDLAALDRRRKYQPAA